MGDRYVDADYEARRRDAFFVAVNCGRAGGTCFCASMNTGPRVTAGFDLALTELLDDAATASSWRSAASAAPRCSRRSSRRDGRRRRPGRARRRRRADRARRWAARWTPTDIRDLLQANPEHPRWDEVADRCLSCGNCTMVCPTCFCSTVEDVTRPRRREAERTRLWDSCFTLEHSYLHGGSVRATTALALPPVDDPQARDLDRPVRHLRLRRLRALHHLVPGRASTSPRRSPRSAPRPAGGACDADDLRTRSARAARACSRSPEHRRDARGLCARRASSTPRSGSCARASAANAFYVIRHGRRGARNRRPGRGAVVLETLHDGELLGWSWLVPPYRTAFDARALGTTACHRARRSLPARQVRGGPGPRLRPDEADLDRLRRAPRRTRGCGCSTSTGRSADDVSRRPPFHVADKRRETRGHVDAAARPADAAADALELRPRPVRDALRVRRRRGADLGQRHRH